VCNSFSGITTNQAEGFNTMLKQYQHWMEAPVDAIVLGLYHLHVFYYNEVQRGLSGLGTYSLQPEFSSLLHPADEAVNLTAYSPEEIVEKMKSQVLTSTVECPTEEEISQIATATECTSDNYGSTKFSRAR